MRKKVYEKFFEGIQWLFEELLFLPFDFLRSIQDYSWSLANAFNFFIALVIFFALVYWMIQLKNFDKKGEEKKDATAHSFL